MDCQEFLRGLKGEDAALIGKLDELRKNLELEKLYLIYCDLEEVAWGIRCDENADLEKIAFSLQDFAKNLIGIEYGAEEKMLVILANEMSEVAYVLNRALSVAGINYSGAREILDADEKKGCALLTIESPYHQGVRSVLTHLLPWLKKVEFSNENEPEEIIQVTEKAAGKIRDIVKSANLPESAGLRFGLVSGGCSGMQYEIKPEPGAKEGDKVLEKTFQDGDNSFVVRIFISEASLRFLAGTIMDYGPVEHLMGEGFIIRNPNEKGSCGCGKSVEL